MRFKLHGTVSYSVGSCHDDRAVVSNVHFSASGCVDAIKVAKAWVNQQRSTFGNFADFCFEVRLLRKNRAFWKATFTEEASSAQDAPEATVNEEILEIVL